MPKRCSCETVKLVVAAAWWDQGKLGRKSLREILEDKLFHFFLLKEILGATEVKNNV